MTKHVSTDEGAHLIRQARRRLIGAIALTTSLVVILPMIFDREPLPSVANEIELQIPDQTNIADLPAVSAVVSVAASEVNASVSMVAGTESARMPATSSAAASMVAPTVIDGSAPSAPVATFDNPAEKTVPASPVKLSPYALQVGAYSSAEKAQAISEKLKKLGFNAYTDPGANNVRVRIGGFRTREAAESVRQTLESQGFHVNLLRLEK